MNSRHYITRFLLLILALLITAAGLAAVAIVDTWYLGPFPVEFFTINFTNWLNGDLALISTAYNFIFYIPLLYLMFKHKCFTPKTFLGIIPVLILSFPLDFFFQLFSSLELDFWVKLIFYFIGVIAASFGFALFQVINLMNFPSIEMAELGTRVTTFKFRHYRMVSDGLTLLIGVLFFALNFQNGAEYATCGIGTVILLIFSAYLIEWFWQILKDLPFFAKFQPN